MDLLLILLLLLLIFGGFAVSHLVWIIVLIVLLALFLGPAPVGRWRRW